MSNETDDRYDIAFAGECLDGHDPATVRSKVGSLFKADADTLERLFSGTRQRIKRNCDKSTALKYQKSLAAVGAKAIVTRASVASTEPTTGSQTQEPDKNTLVDLQLLPGGSDILRPDERAQHDTLTLDLDHLTLGETGDRLSEDTLTTPTHVSTPDFDIAEPGAQLDQSPATPSPPAPDTSALDLADLGTDLTEDGDREESGTAVNTDHLVLAETGSDLLQASERQKSDARAPDTSHLALDTEGFVSKRADTD